MAKYFKDINTLEELRKQYKELLKKHHPDNANGSTQATQEINAEYDRLVTNHQFNWWFDFSPIRADCCSA